MSIGRLIAAAPLLLAISTALESSLFFASESASAQLTANDHQHDGEGPAIRAGMVWEGWYKPSESQRLPFRMKITQVRGNSLEGEMWILGADNSEADGLTIAGTMNAAGHFEMSFIGRIKGTFLKHSLKDGRLEGDVVQDRVRGKWIVPSANSDGTIEGTSRLSVAGSRRALPRQPSKRRIATLSEPNRSNRVSRQSAVGERYVIDWDFDARKAIVAPTGEILVPLPADEPYQKTLWEIEGVVDYRVIDADGGQLIAVRPADSLFRLRVSVQPTLREIPRAKKQGGIPADAVASLNGSAAFAAKNPRTAAVAQSLKADDPVQTVENIRAWIKKNMSYRFSAALKEREALANGKVDAILEAKRGDCGSHASLFVALCRQAGVPARVIWGPAPMLDMSTLEQRTLKPVQDLGPPDKETGLPSNFQELGDFSGHAWAEVYIDGWGWIPLEPQDAATPLGRVPPYVPFNRQAPMSEGMGNETALALLNVIRMNYFPILEKSGHSATAPKKGKTVRPKTTRTRKTTNSPKSFPGAK